MKGENNMKKWIGLVSLCLVCSEAWAGTAFMDSFDTADTIDINSNYATRQAGGVVSAQYTGNQDWYAIGGNKLVHRGGGEIVLNANLADYLVGHDFEISLKQTMLNTNSNWTAVYLTSATEPTRSNSRLGFHTWGTGQLAAVYTVYGGTGAAGAAYTATARTPAQMNALWQENFGTDFDRTAEHLIQFISTAGAGGTNTFDFMVDGVVVIDDKVYTFNDDTVRQIEMVGTIPNHSDGGNGALYDDLTVEGFVPALSTIRLIGISDSL